MNTTRQATRLACAIVAAATVTIGSLEPAKAQQVVPVPVHLRLLVPLAFQIADINPAGSSNPAEFTLFGNELVFRANDGMTGAELWRYDGGSATQIADIWPGQCQGLPCSSGPMGFTVFGNKLVFGADDGSGMELWSYDGGNATKVMDPNTGATVKNPAGFAVFGNKLVFSAEDSAGIEPWSWDGVAFPGRIDDINQVANTGCQVGPPCPGDSTPADFTVFGNKLVFSAFEPANGRELWSWDGVNPPSRTDINTNNTGQDSSSPMDFKVFANKVFFDAADGSGRKLWSYDGTTVAMVRDATTNASVSDPSRLTVFRGELLFQGDMGSGPELVAYDGSNLTAIRDASTGGVISSPFDFAVFTRFTATGISSELVFNGSDATAGSEPWGYDGNGSTASRIDDIEPGSAGSDPRAFTVFGGELVFTASTSTTGRELWSWDGTNPPSIVDDINQTTSLHSSPSDLTVFGSRLVFAANDGAETEPWGVMAMPANLLVQPLGVVRSLGGKLAVLQKLLGSINPNNIAAIIRALEAFIAEIEALLRANRIDEDTAAELIGAAEELIALLTGNRPGGAIPD